MDHHPSFVGALALFLLQACAPRPTVVAPVSGTCLTEADSSVPRLDTVVVALADPLAARFLARHLASNLVMLDCSGALRPELATQWTAEDGGKTWVFILRPVADGGMTAGVVRAGWELQRNGGIWPWPPILGVEVLDSARLRVRLDRAYSDLPAEFADPGLAVGAGPFRTHLTASPGAGPVTVVTYLVPVDGLGPIIKVERLRPGVDPRDALDFPRAGVLSPADVVITSDAATIAYARRRAEFAVLPVGWALTYVLLTRVPTPATALAINDETRQGLVSDVVPGEVRPAAPPFWWDSLPCLSAVKYPSPDPRNGPVIAFLRSDPVARALGERLAAVALTRNRPRTVAMSDLDSARMIGSPNALVLPLPRQRPASCDAITRWPPGSRIDPLVDLRTFVITRRGVPPILLDDDGMIRFNAAESP